MRISEGELGRPMTGLSQGKREPGRAQKSEPRTGSRSSPKKLSSKARKPKAKETGAGKLPVLYMLSPQKFMSPFDCNMAIDSGYTVVLPYDDVAVGDVRGLVQDAMYSRPPKSKTGLFIGGKDIALALDMMEAARSAMVAPFDVSVFADPGGSFTTAGAMVAKVEQVLKRSFARGWEGVRLSVFGAGGVVGFASSVLAASAGARVRIVAHGELAPLETLAAIAKKRFGATLEPVAGQTDARKSKILAASDVVFTAGPAGVGILSRQQIARAPRLLVAADVNAVPPFGIEGMDLHLDGLPIAGTGTLGVGALAIGDVKYKTQAGLFQRMLATDAALDLDFRAAFALAREIVAPVATARPVARRRGGVSAAAQAAR